MPFYLPKILALAAALAWIGTFAAFGEQPQLSVLAATFVTIAFLKIGNARSATWLLICIPALFFVQAELRQPCRDPLDLCRYTGETAVFQAEILAVNDQPQFNRTILVVEPFQLRFPYKGRLGGKAEVIVKGGLRPAPKTGDCAEITGRIVEPDQPREPWRFKQKTRLAQESIFCVAIAHNTKLKPIQRETSGAAQLASCISNSRKRITDLHLSTLGNTYGPLLESIVLGDRCVDLPGELVEKYRKVGLSHLLAASGFNLTIVIVVTDALAGALFRSRLVCGLSCLLPMVVFVALAGLSPSVVRAAACSLIVLIALQSGRSLNAAAVLSLVLITVLTIDPISALDVGAQLSYAATFGILYVARPLALFLAHPLNRWKVNVSGNGSGKSPVSLNWLGKMSPKFVAIKAAFWAVEAIAVVLSAQAAVLPIQLACFWRLGTMFLPASVLVDPLIAPITVIGFASSTLVLASPALDTLCKQLDYVALFPLQALEATASYFASIEGTYLNYGPPPPWTVLAYYAALVLFCVALSTKRWRFCASIIFVAGVTALLWRPALSEPQISIARNSITFVGVDRRAVAFGTEDSSATKFLAYHGARLIERIEQIDGSHSVSLGTGPNRLRFIILNPYQWSKVGPTHAKPDGGTRGTDCHYAHTILTVPDDKFINARQHTSGQEVMWGRRRQKTCLKIDVLDELQRDYQADYIMVIRGRSFRRRGGAHLAGAGTENSAAENDSKSSAQLDESLYYLPLSLHCDRNMQACFFKRASEI
jgi:ComEC/Rec2-related protein